MSVDGCIHLSFHLNLSFTGLRGLSVLCPGMECQEFHWKTTDYWKNSDIIEIFGSPEWKMWSRMIEISIWNMTKVMYVQIKNQIRKEDKRCSGPKFAKMKYLLWNWHVAMKLYSFALAVCSICQSAHANRADYLKTCRY